MPTGIGARGYMAPTCDCGQPKRESDITCQYCEEGVVHAYQDRAGRYYHTLCWDAHAEKWYHEHGRERIGLPERIFYKPVAKPCAYCGERCDQPAKPFAAVK